MKNSERPINPITHTDYQGTITTYFGLTKREYFAAMALQGLLSVPQDTTISDAFHVKYTADLAVLAADSLLEQLKELE